MTDSNGSARDSGRDRAKASAVLGVLLVVLIALMANYLAFRHYARWDLTGDRHFTLSGRTKEITRRLDRDVTIHLFLSRIEENYEDVRELLRRYEASSRHFRVDVVDPDRDRGRYQVLARRFGIGSLTTDQGESAANVAAVVEAGDRNYKIERSDLVSIDFGAEDESRGPQVDVKSERAITSAIVEVTTGRNAKLCLTSGHGEWEREGGTPRSLATLATELELDNVDLETIGFEGHPSVPGSCDALAIVGPQRLFSEDEAKALEAFVKGGGRAFLALDPVLGDATIAPTGLEGVLRGFGIDVGADVVLERDPDHLLGSSPTEGFVANGWGESALVRELRATDAIVAMHMPRSVTASPEGPASALLTTSPAAFATGSLSSLTGSAFEATASDLQGSIGLAAAFPKAPSARGRLVVVGDTDWLRSEVLAEPRFANVDLVSAITGYVASRPAMISIAPRRSSAQALVMTAGDLLSIKLRVIGLLPFAFALLGFSVFWSRRS